MINVNNRELIQEVIRLGISAATIWALCAHNDLYGLYGATPVRISIVALLVLTIYFNYLHWQKVKIMIAPDIALLKKDLKDFRSGKI